VYANALATYYMSCGVCVPRVAYFARGFGVCADEFHVVIIRV
jgi:hypothetical protein